MDDNDDPRIVTVRECLRALRTVPGLAYILVGGCSGLLSGSGRATADIDLLVAPACDLAALHATLLTRPGFCAPQGALAFDGGGSRRRLRMTIDLLTHVVLHKTYTDLVPFTHPTPDADAIPLLDYDVALAIKLHCFYYRQDDANGQRKKRSDLADAAWYAAALHRRQGAVVSGAVAAQFPLGHYQLLLVRLALAPDAVAQLVAVGVLGMLRPWDEDSAEQKEYFSYFAAPGTCPLTGPLADDAGDWLGAEPETEPDDADDDGSAKMQALSLHGAT